MKKLLLQLTLGAFGISSMVYATTLQARGVGAIGNQSNLHATQKMLMARESAIMDAQKNLLEQVIGTTLQTASTRKDTALFDETITKRSEGLIRGALIVSERQIGNKAYEVVMQIEQIDRSSTPLQQASINPQDINYVSIDHSQAQEEVSMDISPNGVNQQNTYQAYQTQSPVYTQPKAVAPAHIVDNTADDDEAPDWLFHKDENGNVIKDNSDLEKKIADLERINKLKEMTIKSIKRQNKM
ncbi:MAG: hypothetical protein KC646_00710 [Candidatus Cloacimonetes bacterium]|nr:hypothetical protein [Candidatus Cloacimonadota bacterium]